MGQAWRWWGVWVVVSVCLVGGVRGVAECTDAAAKGREWKPGAEGKDWTWIDRDRCVRTRAELDEILRLHRLWLGTDEKDGKKADLTGAYLRGADLIEAQFTRANLARALFFRANLTRARLFRADLTGAQFIEADLDGAEFSGANLTEVFFFRANLTGSRLTGADLTGANLLEANLRQANLGGAHLNGTNYEPKEQPAARDIAYANGLDRLTFRDNSAPLVALRKAFQDSGFEQQRRQMTAAIRRSRLHNEHSVMACEGGWRNNPRLSVHMSACASAITSTMISWATFDWTCAWGSDWSHPLVLLAWLCLVWTTPVYWVGMHFGGEGGIYQIVLDKAVATKEAKEVVTRVETGVRWVGRERLRTRSVGGAVRGRSPKLRRRLVGMALRAEWRALRLAFLFSVLSALDIGFHEFNVGVWARMLLTRDFNLKARGWMRVVGGVQSLVGLGLVALSLLSYFGHPFD